MLRYYPQSIFTTPLPEGLPVWTALALVRVLSSRHFIHVGRDHICTADSTWLMSPYKAPSGNEVSGSSLTQTTSIQSHQTDQSYLHPEDAFYTRPTPRKRSIGNGEAVADGHAATQLNGSFPDSRKWRDKRHASRGSRRRRNGKESSGSKGQWKKLLWVKQSYPDNYTDEATFLDHLQRNPRLRPYEFWPLVADSTIIVQHVCSVIIFVCCFTAIYSDRVSPQTVVGWATTGTVAGWVVKDYWQTREMAELAEQMSAKEDDDSPVDGEEEGENFSHRSSSETADFGRPFKEQRVSLSTPTGSLILQPQNTADPANAHITTPIGANAGLSSSSSSTLPTPTASDVPSWDDHSPPVSNRMQERLTTAKSAILIYCCLLGLSPILKSLTKSTSSDSIWALSSWLMILNVFTFDYGAGTESKFPASLSTNAAVMGSTVLASRLPTTTHVFSLTLFSIEVFGLFPVFRRHLRRHSWNGHLLLTAFLVILASSGLSVTISEGGYIMGIVGVVLGGIMICLSMGLTSWWLIGLQRYKNEIRGPWDPARPVLRGVWD